MKRKPKGHVAREPASAGINPPGLAWRLAETLPPAERRKLALRLIETDAEEIVFRRSGLTWIAPVWDRVITLNLFAHGSFQGRDIEAVVGWMRRHKRVAPHRDVFINAGAHIGTTAIPLARKTSCMVLAIEPVPEIHAFLCRNIAENKLNARIEPIPAAIVAGRHRRVRMVLPGWNSGAAEVVRAGHRPSFAEEQPVRRRMTVPAIGLAALLSQRGIDAGRVSLVWADVQCFEEDVISTAPELWAAGVPLFREVDPRLWRNAGRPTRFLRLAAKHFSGFIPAAVLRAANRPVVSPVAELAAFCRSLTRHGGDILLLR